MQESLENSGIDFDFLKFNPIFKNFSPKEISEIFKEIKFKIKHYSKGDLIASNGDSYSHLMIIIKGNISGEIMDHDGKVIRIDELKSSDIIAPIFLFGNESKLPVDVVCIKNAEILVIDKNDLVALFSKNTKVLHNFLNLMADKAQVLSKKIKLLAMNDIKGKIAHFLIEKSNKGQIKTVDIGCSQAQLALLFGVSRPSLTRVIRELHNDNIISANGREIEIVDRSKLINFLK